MSDISLKVRWGPTKSYKLMNFDGTKSCQSIIEEIASKYNLPPDDYHLYSPPTSTRGPLWMENETCLTQCGLQDRDTIEMKFTPATYYVCVGEGSNFNWLDSFTFSENHKNIVGQFKGDPVDPINEYIPVMRTFVTNTKEEYCFLHIKQENSNVTLKWLNSNVSLQEQQVKGGSFILLVQLSAVSSSKRIEAEALQLPTEKSGFLTKKSIKTHKVTNPKKRWCVLRGNFLYYYPSQSQTHASGIIPLEYYDVQQNRNKQKFELTLAHKEESFVANAPTYVLECEDEKEFRDWRHSIIRKSTIGAGTTVFGVMLSDVMSRKTNRNMIPSIITKAVEFLRDADRMKVQGLFRISGLNSAIAKYKEDFDRGLAVNFGSDVDPHVVSGLLKLYVRELPEPLLPFDLYKRFTSIDLSKDNTIQELSALVKEIPPNHRKVLVYLLELLRDVSEYAEENLMTVQNLAVVFGPNILRPREDTTGTLGDTSTVCAITELLIEQQSLIFPSTYAPKSATSSIPKGAFVLPPAGSLKPAVPKSTPPKPKTQRNPSFSSFIPGNPRTPREGSNSSQGLLLQNNRRSQKLTPSSKTNMGIQRSTPPDSPRTEQPELTAEFLYGMLQEEIQARKQLEKKLNSLQEILASLKNDCSSD